MKSPKLMYSNSSVAANNKNLSSDYSQIIIKKLSGFSLINWNKMNYPLNLISQRSKQMLVRRACRNTGDHPEFLNEFLAKTTKKRYKTSSKIDNHSLIIKNKRNLHAKNEVSPDILDEGKYTLPSLSFEDFKTHRNHKNLNTANIKASKLTTRSNNIQKLRNADEEISIMASLLGRKYKTKPKRNKKPIKSSQDLTERLQKLREIIKDPLLYDI